MLQFIQDTIYEITGLSDVTMNTSFVSDLGLSSLDVMNIICALEDHFHITLPTRDAWNLHQVKDLVAYLEEKGITEP